MTLIAVNRQKYDDPGPIQGIISSEGRQASPKGTRPEPPHLPSAPTMRSASSRHKYLHSRKGKKNEGNIMGGLCTICTKLQGRPPSNDTLFPRYRASTPLLHLLQKTPAQALPCSLTPLPPADVQVHPFLVQKVFQAARRGHRHVHPLPQQLVVLLRVHAADAQHDAQLGVAVLQQGLRGAG